MHQGNWTCSSCGGAITELPFEPRSNSGLTCRECYFKKKDGGSAATPEVSDTGSSAEADDRDAPPFDPDAVSLASEPAPEPPDLEAAPAASSERQMFTGDWQCGTCSGPITELPFEPRSTNNLKCRDCFLKEKNGQSQ